MNPCVLFSGIPYSIISSGINPIFRMRAEWIPQGYGIRSARIRNAFRTLCGICGRYIIAFLNV